MKRLLNVVDHLTNRKMKQNYDFHISKGKTTTVWNFGVNSIYIDIFPEGQLKVPRKIPVHKCSETKKQRVIWRSYLCIVYLVLV